VHWVQLGYIRRYRDWSIANRPKATKPRATAVSKNLPNGCAAIVCSVPSRPGAFCRSKVHTEITVRLRRLAGAVISEIEDLDFREPQRHQPTDEDEHFPGLQVVDALSTRWGCRATTTGKVVWAELTIDTHKRGEVPPKPRFMATVSRSGPRTYRPIAVSLVTRRKSNR